MVNSSVIIQHPDEFPIELQGLGADAHPRTSSSLQLRCHSSTPFHSGDTVLIKIPSVDSDMEVNGTVSSCQDHPNGYKLDISFANPDALMRIRMLEQLCYIQRYRRYVLSVEGRDLSTQDAALEWIGRYAHLFPAA